MKRRIILMITIIAAVFAAVVILWPRSARSLISSHQCNYCHQIHGAPGFALLKETEIEVLCMTCHGPGGISTLKADVHQNETRSQYPAFRISCSGCHDPHDNLTNWLGNSNIEIVGTIQDTAGLAKIATPNSGVRHVVFESRGTDAGQPSLHSFADANQDGLNDPDGNAYDGICEVCHTLTKFHRNNSSGGHSHNTGKTCTDCHPHTNYFLK